MKLLPKSEITKLQAQDKKQAIDEGVKLARKIDNLREVASQEEASLDKFRSETLSSINKDISAAALRLGRILSELHELERRKEDALKPIIKETEELEAKKLQFTEEYAKIDSLLAEISHRQVTIEEQKLQVERHLIDTETMKHRQRELLGDAYTERSDATLLATETRQKAEEFAILKAQTESSLAERSQELETLSNVLQKKAEQLEVERLRQTAERVRLADREQTLERELNRLKKLQ